MARRRSRAILSLEARRSSCYLRSAPRPQTRLASLHAERREIPARLRMAREFRDTATNDEHQAIREEEAVLAARIARLEDILVRASNVDHSDVYDSVIIGRPARGLRRCRGTGPVRASDYVSELLSGVDIHDSDADADERCGEVGCRSERLAALAASIAQPDESTKAIAIGVGTPRAIADALEGFSADLTLLRIHARGSEDENWREHRFVE
jgi:hypothetical protein